MTRKSKRLNITEEADAKDTEDANDASIQEDFSHPEPRESVPHIINDELVSPDIPVFEHNKIADAYQEARLHSGQDTSNALHSTEGNPPITHELIAMLDMKLKLEEADLDLKKKRFELERLRQNLGNPGSGRVSSDEVRLDQVNLNPQTLLGNRPSTSQASPVVSLDLTLPRIEIDPFSGSPKEFVGFIHMFEVTVGSKPIDDRQKLAYLIYYCRGAAKEAIQHCSLLPPGECYTTAMQILRAQFGMPHLIAHTVTRDLYDGPNLRLGDINAFQLLLRQMTTSRITLSQLGRDTDLNCSTNLLRIVRRLPKPLQQRWAERVDVIREDGVEPSFEHLTQFIRRNASIINTEYGQLAYESPKTSDPSTSKANFRVTTSRIVNQRILCILCKVDHDLDRCQKFKEMDVKGRWNLLRENKRCYVCLKAGHRSRECRSSKSCDRDGCGRRHNVLLHNDVIADGQPPSSNHVCGTHGPLHRQIQLGFVPVILKGPERSLKTYALLDNGADCTLIDKSIANQLGIDSKPQAVVISTLHGTRSVPCGKGDLVLMSLSEEFETTVDNVLIVDSLPVERATKWSQFTHWPHLRDVTLTSLDDDRVGILLGCNVPEAHWSLDQRIGTSREPFASKSLLGWTIRGPSGSVTRQCHQINATTADSIHSLLQRLYNTEFTDATDPEGLQPSLEDEQAVKMVEDSANYRNGQFELAVPWKPNAPLLHDNRPQAEKRLNSLRRRLQHDSSLKDKYVTTITEYLIKGYVSPVRTQGRRWYLPHHPVLNPKKPEKIRIVFDCAASFKAMSLNDALLQGPDWTNKLIGVLTRFRQYPVAVSADIKEMFLQVSLAETDRWAFSFLWWPSEHLSGAPQTYEWNVHPFGAKSSPFCANYALKRALTDSTNTAGTNMTNMFRNFYVDDYLASFKTKNEAKSSVEELRQTLSKGHFDLTKWVSTHEEVLKDIPASACLFNPEEQVLTDHCLRTLGVKWDVQKDIFCFEVSSLKQICTRRSILSYIAAVYDPLGFIAPVILVGKIILQELCRLNRGWDEPLEDHYQQAWSTWCDSLQHLKHVKVPRCLTQLSGHAIEHELHVFSDASERGYGAASYLRTLYENGDICCRLILGKARVAPLKPVSVPRLELTAALVAAKISRELTEQLDVKIERICLWTDSSIVLHYLANTSTRYATFVANRLRRIQELTSPSQWRFVSSSFNPADIASRGIASNTPKLSTWLCGPEWLSTPDHDWPHMGAATQIDMELLEIKRNVLVVHGADRHPWLFEYARRCPTWMRLLKSIVWLTRFKLYMIMKLKARPDLSIFVGVIKVNELKQATIDIVRMCQDAYFPHERSTVVNETVDRTVPDLRRLRPIEKEGVLYLSGRTCLASRSTQLLILPNKCPITDLLIKYQHELNGHMGATYVLAALRRHVWIIKGMAAVKRVLSRCSKCQILRAPTCQQVMAPLPLSRVDSGTYPFRFCGVDYFGVFHVTSGRKLLKRFGCLFTCMQTRAVHIEVAQELSTDSFMMALIRFISRRGAPQTIYSDNGTNLVGAESELKRLLTSLDQKRISDGLQVHSIDWVFNPPYSSHRGGVWERMIRTVKRTLNFVTKEQPMSDEVLMTSLAEIERIINDRPLIPVYDDPQQLNILRPNDLLLLRPNPGLANDAIPLRERYTRRWRQSQHLANMFWKRWRADYFPTLRLTQKWFSPQRDLRLGDLVLIQKPGTPRGHWPKGIVQKIFPGPDNHVRQVELKTTQGNLRRDIRSLCLLEGTLEVQ